MPRRVDPQAYRRESPIFAQLLLERDGRYPGTPEGEEDIHIELTPVEPPNAPPTYVPEPTEPDPSTTMVNRLVSVQALSSALAAVTPVTPILPPAPEPVEDPQETQPMKVPDFGEKDPDDDEAA